MWMNLLRKIQWQNKEETREKRGKWLEIPYTST